MARLRLPARVALLPGTGLLPTQLIDEGLVRRHRGDRVYEGTRRGAVFPVILPPFGG